MNDGESGLVTVVLSQCAGQWHGAAVFLKPPGGQQVAPGGHAHAVSGGFTRAFSNEASKGTLGCEKKISKLLWTFEYDSFKISLCICVEQHGQHSDQIARVYAL